MLGEKKVIHFSLLKLIILQKLDPPKFYIVQWKTLFSLQGCQPPDPRCQRSGHHLTTLFSRALWGSAQTQTSLNKVQTHCWTRWLPTGRWWGSDLQHFQPHRQVNSDCEDSLSLTVSLTASPSLYEMAALTSELDTSVITSKVKEILLQHNVGQKVSSGDWTVWYLYFKFWSHFDSDWTDLNL